MKILLVHKWLVMGGVETILRNYANMLSQTHKLDVLIECDLQEDNKIQGISDLVNIEFLFGRHVIEKQRYLGSQRKKSILNKLRYEWFKLVNLWQFNQKINAHLKNHHYDVIIDFSGCLDRWIRLPRLFRFAVDAVLVRWVHSQLNGSNGLRARQAKKFHQVFTQYDKVVAICNQMAEVMSKTLQLPNLKFAVISNPIDMGFIRKKAEEAISLPFNAPYLLQVSRLVEGKGHEEMLCIFAQLKQKGIPHKLLLIGEGENRVDLERLIVQYGLEQECFLLGEKSNPYPYFKKASVFLHTSEHEGLPTVLLESMALGVPVVAMDCLTGPRDILGLNSEYGKLVGLHDKQGFVDAVMDLLDFPEQYQYYQQKSLQRVESYSMDHIQERLNELLESLKSS